MAIDFLLLFVQMFFGLLEWAILIHVVYSWVRPQSTSFFYETITSIVSPFYKIVRRIVPPLGMFDLSPLLSLILVEVLGYVCMNLILRFSA